ncbi:hypothetical protein SAMN04487974_101358 [Pelagibacterium luteolum]|uniref:Uncharacterized protein n=1 Tax=Pelagibacterium luteolum TaxID=440168 RepID=A0A1G7S8B5_9HYPH|nr:hypothetical protein SAMN04487974_101358 [Pelagibacterium luteolum]
MNRAEIESEIERLIALLDAMDGDTDLEPDSDDEHEPDQWENPVSLWRDQRPAKQVRRVCVSCTHPPALAAHAPSAGMALTCSQGMVMMTTPQGRARRAA